MKRIPRIKFPQRHPKPSDSGTPTAASATAESKGFAQSVTQVQTPPPSGSGNYRFKGDVPAPPSNMAVGGKASDLPKRAPLSEKEIEAIMLGGCF